MTGIRVYLISIVSVSLILKNAAADLDARMRFKHEDAEDHSTEEDMTSTDTWTASTENTTDDNTADWLTTADTTKAIPGELRVVVNPTVLQVRHGETVELICIVYGGDSSTLIVWRQVAPKPRYALTDQIRKTDETIGPTKVTLRSRMTLDTPEKTGVYACTAQNTDGTTASATLTIEQGSGTARRKRSLTKKTPEFVTSCQPNEIDCLNASPRSRRCIETFLTCDGERDCENGSDEQQHYCDLFSRSSACRPSEFQCLNSSAVCIRRSRQCDGHFDCPDHSDEIGCVKPTVLATGPRQLEMNSGETLTMRCTVHGFPAPYINWRHHWGHICGDGDDKGRCTTKQSIDAKNRAVVTGVLTIRNVSANDAGQYSCEAHNNRGFIIAVPDSIVTVTERRSINPAACHCHGHSPQCTDYGLCLNCQHHTDGYHCEHCAQGYTGDARRGTPNDCQIDDESGASSIRSDYYYRITNEGMRTDLALEVVNRDGDYAITMAPMNNSPGQYWRIVPLANNIYSLRTRLLNDSYSAELVDGKTSMKMHMTPTANSIGQHWYLLPIGNRTFRLTNQLSGSTKYLNVDPETKTVFMGSDTGHSQQQYWKLTKLAEIFPH